MLADGILGNSVINNEAGDTTHLKDTDSEIVPILGRVTRIEAGSIVAGAMVKTDYEYQVDDDVIDGIDDATGKPEGLELVNSVFPMFGLVPSQVGPLVGPIIQALLGIFHLTWRTDLTKCSPLNLTPQEGLSPITLNLWVFRLKCFDTICCGYVSLLNGTIIDSA